MLPCFPHVSKEDKIIQRASTHPSSRPDGAQSSLHYYSVWLFCLCAKNIWDSIEAELRRLGVPVVAQWLTNPTRNREAVGSIPGLAQWVRIQCCRELWCRYSRRGSDLAMLCLWCRLAATAPIGLLAWEPPYAAGAALKRQDKNKERKEEIMFVI